MSGALDPVRICAQQAMNLAWAKIQGDQDAITRLESHFQKFGDCDARWAETIEKYIEYYWLDKQSIPYRSGGDYTLDVQLAADARIGIIGDWGTGSSDARELLKQVAAHRPSVVIHLGDIYYSGTPYECQTCFLDDCRRLLADGCLVFTLSGNHDMYSGGHGYYWLVDQLNQQASYFCIENEHWQFLAMDTGYHDFNPWSVNDNVTYLTDQEIAWNLWKIQERGSRKTVLLSHHQLFSTFEPIGRTYINDHLLGQFQPVLDKIAIWFWGHEHRLDFYDAYQGLSRGRCLGCSAVPTEVAADYYSQQFPEVPLLPDAKEVRLTEMKNGTYSHAYAVMSLAGPDATISYYDQTNPGAPIFKEAV